MIRRRDGDDVDLPVVENPAHVGVGLDGALLAKALDAALKDTVCPHAQSRDLDVLGSQFSQAGDVVASAASEADHCGANLAIGPATCDQGASGKLTVAAVISELWRKERRGEGFLRILGFVYVTNEFKVREDARLGRFYLASAVLRLSQSRAAWLIFAGFSRSNCSALQSGDMSAKHTVVLFGHLGLFLIAFVKVERQHINTKVLLYRLF